MAIQTGEIIQADDFIDSSSGASDEGKVAKLNASGVLGASFNNIFGDGSDGDVVISTPTTLTRNMYYDNLTVNDTLTTDGYQIFVKGTLSGTGSIDWGNANDGGDGVVDVAGIGGAQSGSGVLKNTAGGTGATGEASSTNNGASVSGAEQLPCIGSDGADGGTGGTGYINVGGTGTGGVATSIRKFGIILYEILAVLSPDETGSLVNAIPQGQASGGGAGGGDDNGGSGSPRTGGGGGGGGAGGNGGTVIVVYGSKDWSGSYVLTGGTGGAGGTTPYGSAGSVGSNGATGTYYEIN